MLQAGAAEGFAGEGHARAVRGRRPPRHPLVVGRLQGDDRRPADRRGAHPAPAGDPDATSPRACSTSASPAATGSRRRRSDVVSLGELRYSKATALPDPGRRRRRRRLAGRSASRTCRRACGSRTEYPELTAPVLRRRRASRPTSGSRYGAQRGEDPRHRRLHRRHHRDRPGAARRRPADHRHDPRQLHRGDRQPGGLRRPGQAARDGAADDAAERHDRRARQGAGQAERRPRTVRRGARRAAVAEVADGQPARRRRRLRHRDRSSTRSARSTRSSRRSRTPAPPTSSSCRSARSSRDRARRHGHRVRRAVGLGEITADDGESLAVPLHRDRRRHARRSTSARRSTFELLAQLGRYEATAITPRSTLTPATSATGGILDVIRALGPGEVVTYGDIADDRRLSRSSRASSVGCWRRHDEDDLPWWRVVNAAGRLVPGHERSRRRCCAPRGEGAQRPRRRGPARPLPRAADGVSRSAASTRRGR